MCARRHAAHDDNGDQGFADALARWDTAQSWMRFTPDPTPEPGGPPPPVVEEDSWDAILSAEPPPAGTDDPWARPATRVDDELDDQDQGIWLPHAPVAAAPGSHRGTTGISSPDQPPSGAAPADFPPDAPRPADPESSPATPAPGADAAGGWPRDPESPQPAGSWPPPDPASADPRATGPEVWPTPSADARAAAPGPWPPPGPASADPRATGPGVWPTPSTDARAAAPGSWPPPADFPSAAHRPSDDQWSADRPSAGSGEAPSAEDGWSADGPSAGSDVARSAEDGWSADGPPAGSDVARSAGGERFPDGPSAGWDDEDGSPSSADPGSAPDTDDGLSGGRSAGPDADGTGSMSTAGHGTWPSNSPSDEDVRAAEAAVPDRPAVVDPTEAGAAEPAERSAGDEAGWPADEGSTGDPLGRPAEAEESPVDDPGWKPRGGLDDLSDDDWLAHLRGAGQEQKTISTPEWAAPATTDAPSGWSAPDRPGMPAAEPPQQPVGRPWGELSPEPLSPEALSPEALSPEALSPEALSPEAPLPGGNRPWPAEMQHPAPAGPITPPWQRPSGTLPTQHPAPPTPEPWHPPAAWSPVGPDRAPGSWDRPGPWNRGGRPAGPGSVAWRADHPAAVDPGRQWSPSGAEPAPIPWPADQSGPARPGPGPAWNRTEHSGATRWEPAPDPRSRLPWPGGGPAQQGPPTGPQPAQGPRPDRGPEPAFGPAYTDPQGQRGQPQPGWAPPPAARRPDPSAVQRPHPPAAQRPGRRDRDQPPPPVPTVDELTAQSLLRQRRSAPQTGWRRALYTLSAHTVNPGQSAEDRRRQELIARATVPVRGCYRLAVISLKGGVGKTTTTVALGATLASLRGDRVIAVDANPDRGTLSGKIPLETVATVRNLLNDAGAIQHYFDVRRYTSQSQDRLEVLASESDPAVSTAFSEGDYRTVASILQRFYNVVLTDCGTGLLHSAMAGVLDLADQIVLVSSGSVDGARSASATLDWLEAHGRGDLVRNSVAVINSVRPKSGGVDLGKLEAHFAARCRAVTRIPYDPHLEEGAEVDLGELNGDTRGALLELAANVADAFPRDDWPAPLVAGRQQPSPYGGPPRPSDD